MKYYSVPLKDGIYKSGLPLVTFQVGNFSLCFIVDTGIVTSFIDSSVIDQIGDYAVRENNCKHIKGIDGCEHFVESTATLTLTLQEKQYTHTFACEPLYDALKDIETQSNYLLHGVIGNDFLVKSGWIIDYNKLKIFFT